LQVKVLRVVQENEINMLGENTARKVDVRIIAASNRDLKRMVDEGAFRQDLYYRLNVAPLFLPPLRDRKEDIPLLARFFMEEVCGKQDRSPVRLGGEILRKLEDYDWPGNVRELKNCMERLAIFSGTDSADVQDLPEEIRSGASSEGKALFKIPAEGVSLTELDRTLVEAALERHGYNQTRAAKFLGISRNALIYRMQKYGLGPKGGPESDRLPESPAGGGITISIKE
jgi:two-component system NtrC family response regulator